MVTDVSVLLRNLQAVLDAKTPLLPQRELRAFVNHYLSQRDNYLQVLAKYPPPLYILDSSILKQRALQFREAFEDALPDVFFYYAVNSNNHPCVAKTLLQSEFGLDVSSGLELETALGLKASDIVFSGPGKTEQELILAVLNSEKVIVLVDSFGELHRLENIAAFHNKTVRAGVRLTLSAKGLWRKFGIPIHALPAFWKDARQCSHVMLQGLQFHVSWNLSPKAQIRFIRALGRQLSDMPSAFRRKMAFIDIGGGYWPPQGEWLQAAGTPEGRIRDALGKRAGSGARHYRRSSQPIGIFSERLGAALRRYVFNMVSCRIFLEPGRWICNDAMHLFLSVVDRKASDLVITDAGTNAVGWERFETDYFPILNLTRPSLKERACDVLGSLCTPHDIWGYSYWGDDIQLGDILMVPTQGAYTYSLRQHFIKPVPPVITI